MVFVQRKQCLRAVSSAWLLVELHQMSLPLKGEISMLHASAANNDDHLFSPSFKCDDMYGTLNAAFQRSTPSNDLGDALRQPLGLH